MNTKKIIESLTPLIARFPCFPMSNIRFNRNFVSIADQSLELKETLPHIIGDYTLSENALLKCTYVDNQAFSYNKALIKEFEKNIVEKIHDLQRLLGDFKGLTQDIQKIKDTKTKFSSNCKKLIHVSPFIYDGAGKRISNLDIDTFDFSGFAINELQSLYTDHFREHLAPLLISFSNKKGYGEVHKLTRNCLNQFIEKTVIPSTNYYSTDNQVTKERSLILEEVPTLFTPLRGAIGGDCSMMSVPYFGLLNGTKVFWVIRSDNERERPAGYVFLAELNDKNKTMPLVITINGPTIQKSDCQVIFKMLSAYYNNPKVATANWQKNSFLVNSPFIRDSIDALIKIPIEVQLPTGWSKIPSGGHFQNYYSLNTLSNALELDLEKISCKIIDLQPAYFKNLYDCSEPKEMSLVSRSIITYYFSMLNQGGESIQQAQELLNLQPHHTKNIESLINLYQRNQMNTEDFKKLNSTFGFDLSDLSRIDLNIRKSLILPLYLELKDLFPASEWSQICKSTFNQLREESKTDMFSDTTKDYLASIPDEFIPEYWEVIKPFFYLPEQSYPDHYMLRRFVKHFYSYGTIEQFLNFLNSTPEVTQVRIGTDSRWTDFFLRAKDLMPENSDYQELIKKVFYDHPLDAHNNYDFEELTSIYCNGLLFLENIDSQKWLKNIFSNRSLDQSEQESVLALIKSRGTLSCQILE